MQRIQVQVVGWCVTAHRRSVDETGSVLPLVAVLLVAIAGLVVAVGAVGGEVVTAARARAAADAAALAGAAEGEGAARQLAAVNGGRIVAYDSTGPEVQVAVEVAGTIARARAVRRGGEPLGGSSIGLTPEMRAAIAAAEAALGRPVPITSGWRSAAAQRALWARRATNPFPVARPGSSAHERGTAIDVPRAFAPSLARVGRSVGLCQPLPTSDPVHFELCRATGRVE